MRKQKQKDYSLTNRQLGFGNHKHSVMVSVNTNISAFEFVRDVLTRHITKFIDGKRIQVEVPVYHPAYNNTPSEKNKAKLKEAKSKVKAMVGSNYRPTTILRYV